MSKKSTASNTHTHTHNKGKKRVPIVSEMLAALEHKIPISSRVEKKRNKRRQCKKKERKKAGKTGEQLTGSKVGCARGGGREAGVTVV